VKAHTPGGLLLQKVRHGLFRAAGSHMLHCDGTQHARLRGLVGAAVTRRRVEALAPRIQQIAHDLLKALDTTTPTDLIDGFAYPLPWMVICEMIGVPEQDRDEFRRNYTVISSGPPFVCDDEYIVAAEDNVTLIRSFLADRRAHSGDDLLSDLITVREGRDQLTDDELTSMVNLLVIAGHETTVNLIGNGIHALLAPPRPTHPATCRTEPHRLGRRRTAALRIARAGCGPARGGRVARHQRRGDRRRRDRDYCSAGRQP
jgi:cytochrome P450